MSEAAKRTSEWRDQRRDGGYLHLDIWIPAHVKNLLTNLASQRRQALHETVADAIAALANAKTAGTAGVFTLRQVEALIERKLAEDRASQQPAWRVLPLPQPAPQQPADPLPAGMRLCKRGHLCQVGEECKPCNTIRQQESRQNQAAKKRGEIPAL
jgi:hypothetical protein